MTTKEKIIAISALVLFLIGLTFFVDNHYKTRISAKTPQATERECPNSRPIKGNAQTGIFHMPYGSYYDKTLPERCFSSKDEAIKAGYRQSLR